MKVVLPVEEFEGLKSIVSQHFGRAPFFAVVDLRDGGGIEGVRGVENKGEHIGGRTSVEQLVGGIRPDALIVKGMGPRALYAFQSQGIAVFTGEFSTVEEAVKGYVAGRLRSLTESCKEARHRF